MGGGGLHFCVCVWGGGGVVGTPMPHTMGNPGWMLQASPSRQLFFPLLDLSLPPCATYFSPPPTIDQTLMENFGGSREEPCLGFMRQRTNFLFAYNVFKAIKWVAVTLKNYVYGLRSSASSKPTSFS